MLVWNTSHEMVRRIVSNAGRVTIIFAIYATV